MTGTVPSRTDSRAHVKGDADLTAAIATLDETLEVNAIARDRLAKARARRGRTSASRLALDKALGQLALSSESTSRALATAKKAAGVTP